MLESPTYTVLGFFGQRLPQEYEALIFSKWLRSLRKGNDYFHIAEAADYYKIYHAYIEKLLNKPGMRVRIAVLSDDPDVVLGFSCAREDVLDYVYIQPEQRGQKLTGMLIPDNITAFTHMTKTWLPIWQAKYKHWKFNPFA